MSDLRESTVPDPRDGPGARRPWTPPRLEVLRPLTELTLQTGGAIPGHGDTGGGTVF
ncbi:MAG TPA: hypothetical protein VF188_11480 [Longimicrobiales bacterium]